MSAACGHPGALWSKGLPHAYLALSRCRQAACRAGVHVCHLESKRGMAASKADALLVRPAVRRRRLGWSDQAPLTGVPPPAAERSVRDTALLDAERIPRLVEVQALRPGGWRQK